MGRQSLVVLVLSCLLRSENQPANGEAESRHNGERLFHQRPVLSVLGSLVVVRPGDSILTMLDLSSHLSLVGFARLDS